MRVSNENEWSSPDAYQITLVSVTFSVKFPCRMSVEMGGTTLTREITASNNNVYRFDQDITLRKEGNQSFELIVNLHTEKGSKYVGGIIKLSENDLQSLKGKKMSLLLQRCVDPEANCRLTVHQVAVPRQRTNSRSQAPRRYLNRQSDEDQQYVIYQSRLQSKNIHVSKSQFQFPQHHSRMLGWETKTKAHLAQKSPQKLQFSVNRANHVPSFGNFAPIASRDLFQIAERDKLIEAEVYKQGYLKLKEKYRKQTENSKEEMNRRISLENNENNLKLQIMRLKLKAEQLERVLAEKNNKNRQLQADISQLQLKESEYSTLNEMLVQRQQQLVLMEETVRESNAEIQRLRKTMKEKSQEQVVRIRQLKKQLENMKYTREGRERQLEKQLKVKNELVVQKDSELKIKGENLDRLRQHVNDLERENQAKLFEFEKALQNQKSTNKIRLTNLQAQIARLQRQLAQLAEASRNTVKDNERIKLDRVKSEYDVKLAQQQLESLRNQSQVNKANKDKYNQISYANKQLQEEKMQLERQLEKVMLAKEAAANESNKNFGDRIQQLRKVNKQLQEKIKVQMNRLVEVQSKLEICEGHNEQLKKTIQYNSKELSEVKQKQKSVRRALKEKEQQTSLGQNEQATLKQRLKSVEQINKLEAQRMKNQYDRVYCELQKYKEESAEIITQNTRLTTELGKANMRIQFNEQKYEKQAKNNQKMQRTLQNQILDYKNQLTEAEKKLSSLVQSQKQTNIKQQKQQDDIGNCKQEIDRLRKQTKIVQERQSFVANSLKLKTEELTNLQKQKVNLQNQLLAKDRQLSQLKNQNSATVTERNKLNKMLELLQEQLKRIKQNNNNYVSQANRQQIEEEKLKSELKQAKEEQIKLEIKLTNYQRESQRQRANLMESIEKSLFTISASEDRLQKKSTEDASLFRMAISQDTDNQQRSILKDQMFSKEFEELNIASIIVTQGKQIKGMLKEQTQLVRKLQSENESLKQRANEAANNSQNQQNRLRVSVQTLRKQISRLTAQNQSVTHQFEYISSQLKLQLLNKQISLEELTNHCDELSFAVKSLQMQLNSVSSSSKLTIKTLKAENGQLVDQNRTLQQKLDKLQQQMQQSNIEQNKLRQVITLEQELIAKKEKALSETTWRKQTAEEQVDELKRSKKELMAQIEESQLHLTLELENNSRLKQATEAEIKKKNELAMLLENILKEKEFFIKRQIERNDKIVELESQIINLKRQKQMIEEEQQSVSKTVDKLRQDNKRLTSLLKEAEMEKRQAGSKKTKISDVMREKERELLQKSEEIINMKRNHQQHISRLEKELQELQQAIDAHSKNFQHDATDKDKRIMQKQIEIKKLTGLLAEKESELAALEKEYYLEKQKVEQSYAMINSLKEDINELKTHNNDINIRYNDLMEEIKEKQEQLFESLNKASHLEHKIHGLTTQHVEELENVHIEWSAKHNSTCYQYEQRIQAANGQRDYFKALLEEREKELAKATEQIKNSESNEKNIRKSYEELMRKIQDDKLATYSNKNKQIQKLISDKKTQEAIVREKQFRIQELLISVQQLQEQLSAQISINRKIDEQARLSEANCEAELHKAKKKQIECKEYFEHLANGRWNAQRQIKKAFQTFIRELFDSTEDKSSQTTNQQIKALQNIVLEASLIKGLPEF